VAPSFFSFERDPHARAGNPEFQKANPLRVIESNRPVEPSKTGAILMAPVSKEGN
jgi:predicted transcriptional regulator